MSEHQPSEQIVVVTGDVTMDWNLVRSRKSESSSPYWHADDMTRACWQRGGAALLADLVEQMASTLSHRVVVHQNDAPRAAVTPGDARFHHSYALWSLAKYGQKSSDAQERPAWRVAEFLGLDPAPRETQAAAADWQRVVKDPPAADLVVLDDADLGFRDCPELWPQSLRSTAHRPWVLLKMSRPVADGPLWEFLRETLADRLVVLMSADDLRLTQVQISRELSWERTAQDVVWELMHNPCVNALSECAHVIVSFFTAGAVWLSRQPTPERVTASSLIFDPKVVEGMWAEDHAGGMIGYTTCLCTSLAHQIILNPLVPNIANGIQTGIAASRTLHREGYGDRGTSSPTPRLAFPIQLMARELVKENAPFSRVAIQDPLRFLNPPMRTIEDPASNGYWSILHDHYQGQLDQVAADIVRLGADKALRDVPLGQFGDLLTVDRHEIESFRSLRALIAEYCRQDRTKPLSVAVFGPPGSGKSFGITQVANSVLPGKIKPLTFNLSQFASPDDLIAALHQVRDVALSGKIPLVFWDEFDTTFGNMRLAWLRYFLAPMQDGEFQQGQLVHPIGRSIFVFAGGTCACMDDFGRALGEDAFRAAKGPDFLSRLRGYVNILGPNSQGNADPYMIIRRAILLRSMLQRNAKPLFEKANGQGVLRIDTGVLQAFLKTREYRHGARSMEAAIAMSMLTGQVSFERSALPAETQLDLHVDGRDFLALVQQMNLEGELLERLAEYAHDAFCEELRAQGYTLGDKTDAVAKTHTSLRPFAQLPETEQDQNRGFVCDIPNKLACAGYVMIPARSNEPAFDFPGDALERLGEHEHDRWMMRLLRDGWRYAPVTDKPNHLHQCLLAWRELAEEEKARRYGRAGAEALGASMLPDYEKDKDRKLVHRIPGILARAGYAIVKRHDHLTK